MIDADVAARTQERETARRLLCEIERGRTYHRFDIAGREIDVTLERVSNLKRTIERLDRDLASAA
jgi:hypothetical protein